MLEQFAGVLAVPLILGLVEAVKRAGLPVSYCAPLSIMLGVALSLGYQWAAVDVSTRLQWADAVIVGLGLGLSASGLYSGTKKALEVA